MEWRNHVIIREVCEAIRNVTADIVSANHRHTDGFLVRCAREPGGSDYGVGRSASDDPGCVGMEEGKAV